jgi:hypothetical protein
MMKNLPAGLLIGAILGTTLGFVAGMLCFPLLFPAPAMSGAVSDSASGDLLETGSFAHADPSDPTHYGSGSVTVFTDLVRLERDFEVGPGPDYHVYLAPEADVTPDSRVEETMFVDLGPLKAFAGSQGYRIPRGTDLSDYRSVVIWSEHFNQLISAARLSSAQK